MFVIEVSEEDRRRTESLVDELAGRFTSVEDPALLDELTLYAQELPRSIREQVNRFRLHEPSGCVLFAGFRVREDRIGPTPSAWDAAGPGAALREDLHLLLCGSLLGDPIAWATQQDGRLVHDVIPIEGHEHEQINSSTAAPLWWHTEDAFHPYRADYVGLMCLRNPDRAETTLTYFDDLALDPASAGALAEAHYVIRPDESHLPKNRDGSGRLDAPAELIERSLARIERMSTAPEPTAVLFGDPRRPYGRLDPYFMDLDDIAPEAARAFDELVKAIDDRLTGVVLSPGDVLFVDNYKAVHGRKPYTARYDGADRWLRRINIARDLRKSRDARNGPAARVIF
ncbi:guanitoxin biosynthesis L-enduracididine beta-hydroxylase GntD [Streptomyces sp. SID14515]|uniref:guanitoxin biosynthesis L-enduracididine beta-hydroxylase GntD n=1 Tax=Streptomyces sp. SID14515 TaxID=2706074 RepID=UPI0013C5FC87|nr:guanitoxin biosynthesis L-enduracididine beta-hydroxylase GntD [Streptomyces sp. SID14515]NEB36276.1 arginine beta-hydroxylase, Fe(II)/alpha-ketoglutarate-dependent [Streptomyces sp. SID14515]